MNKKNKVKEVSKSEPKKLSEVEELRKFIRAGNKREGEIKKVCLEEGIPEPEPRPVFIPSESIIDNITIKSPGGETYFDKVGFEFTMSNKSVFEVLGAFHELKRQIPSVMYHG